MVTQRESVVGRLRDNGRPAQGATGGAIANQDGGETMLSSILIQLTNALGSLVTSLGPLLGGLL
jgi:hypothetical protein